MARQLGYTEAQLEALNRETARGAFESRLELGLQYAEQVTRDPHTVSEEFFAQLRRHYTDVEIVELTTVVSLANYWNRFAAALRVNLSGSNAPYEAGPQ